jgi:predicted membrane protein DUF2232
MALRADGWGGHRSVSNRSKGRDSSMMQLYLIGLSAGFATALLYASVASGSLLSVVLFYLAPLPILIAALGWSHWAALIAAVVASASLAALFGAFFFIAFLLGVGLPAWWLGYLALLARPAATAPGGLEWYPVGHLVLWAAIISALIVTAVMINFGADEESFRASLRRGLERMFSPSERSASGPAAPVPRPELSPLIELMIVALPPAAAVLTTVTGVANLWLAKCIVKVSGRLRRPLPDLAAMQFPAAAPAITALAIAAWFLPGLPGTVGSVFSASLLTAYAILGFAVLHAMTRGRGGRPFVLSGIYVAVIVFAWPALLMSLLGLADTAFDLRGRIDRKRNPPHSGT